MRSKHNWMFPIFTIIYYINFHVILVLYVKAGKDEMFIVPEKHGLM